MSSTSNPQPEPTRVPEAVLREKLLGLSDAVYIPNDTRDDTGVIIHVKLTEVISLFEATMLEIIGEDDIPYGNELYPAKKGAVERNELRKEQRSHLYKLLGRGKNRE